MVFIWQHRSKCIIVIGFSVFSFSAAPPVHPHAGPAALGCGSGRALRPLLRTPVPLMVALGFTLFRAPPRESPRGQPCGGGAPNRRCGSDKKRSPSKAVYSATAFLLIFHSAAAFFCIFYPATAFLELFLCYRFLHFFTHAATFAYFYQNYDKEAKLTSFEVLRDV